MTESEIISTLSELIADRIMKAHGSLSSAEKFKLDMVTTELHDERLQEIRLEALNFIDEAICTAAAYYLNRVVMNDDRDAAWLSASGFNNETQE